MHTHPACVLDFLRYVAGGCDGQLLAHNDMRQRMESRVCCCGKQPIWDVMFRDERCQYCIATMFIMLC